MKKTLEGTDANEIEKIKRLLAKHGKFDVELQIEYDECKDIVKHGIPVLIDQRGENKDKEKWILEYQNLLSASLNVRQSNEIYLKKIITEMEKFITWEIIVKDLIHDAYTYKSKK